jgi:hypothetical protein
VTEYLKELLIPAGTHASSILPDGTVLAVYDTDSGAGMALVTIAEDESLPTPVKTPECSYDLPYCRHSAAVTAAGDTIYVAYVQSPGIGDVKEELYLVMLKGGESGEPVLVPTTQKVTYAPVLSTNGTAVWLGWGEVDETTMTGIPRDFWVLRVDGAPGTPAKLPKDKDTDGPLTFSPAIPVGSGGEIHTGLVEDTMNLTGEGKPYVLLAFHKKYDGTTWSEVGTVSGGDDTPVMVGKSWMAVDASGKADVLWEDVETASVQSVLRAARF